jgi:hypothetical protein
MSPYPDATLTRTLPTFAAGLALLAATPALAAVTVSFDHPERFTDASQDNNDLPAARAALLKRLAAAFAADDHLLPAGDTLTIRVLDVDLAGDYPLSRPLTQTRVYRRDTWPTIRLHYALTGGGRILADADTTLTDKTYLIRSNQYFSSDPLRYERPMIDDWVRGLASGQ